MQRFIKYLAMFVLFIVIYYLGSKIVFQFKQDASKNFKIIPYFVAEAVFSYILGMVLGIPYFLQEIRKQGVWNFDWIKALSLVIPSLFISFMPLMMMANLFNFSGEIIIYFRTPPFGIAGIYLLITSFYKSPEIAE